METTNPATWWEERFIYNFIKLLVGKVKLQLINIRTEKNKNIIYRNNKNSYHHFLHYVF